MFRWLERVEHGYVVYTNDYEREVALAERWFADQGIIIHGRFGRHQYFNVDACLRSSIELAGRLGAQLTDDDILHRFTRLANAR